MLFRSKSIADRTAIEHELESSRKLSLAANSLFDAISAGNQAFSKEISNVKQFGNNLVNEILDCVSKSNQNEKVPDRGICSLQDLKVEFSQNIAPFCRLSQQTSLFGTPLDTENNILMSKINNLHNWFNYSLNLSPTSMAPPSSLNPSELTTAESLAYATFCVQNDDLEQAARFLVQIDNARIQNIASEWIVEVNRRSEFLRVSEVIRSIGEATSLGLC